jgi:hypothetical protein
VSAEEWLTLPAKACAEKNALSQRPRKSEKPTDEKVLDDDASVCLSHWILGGLRSLTAPAATLVI